MSPMPPITARCSTCFRTERWSADGTQVVTVEGGHRRPPEPAYRKTWSVLRAWKQGGDAVVGTCDLCSQPMTSTDAHAKPVTGWTLTLPTATVTVGEWLTVATDGAAPKRVSLDEVDALVGTRSMGERVQGFVGPVSALPFLLLVVGLVLLIFSIWLFGANFFLSFIWNAFASKGFTQA